MIIEKIQKRFYKERVKIRTPYIICNDIMYNTRENIAESDSECFRRCICICILCYVLFVYVEQKGNRGDRRCRVRWIGKKVSGTRCLVVRNVLTGKNIEVKIYGEDYDTRN